MRDWIRSHLSDAQGAYLIRPIFSCKWLKSAEHVYIVYSIASNLQLNAPMSILLTVNDELRKLSSELCYNYWRRQTRGLENPVIICIYAHLESVRQIELIILFFLINVCLNTLRKILNVSTGDASPVFPGKVIYCLLLNYSCQFFLITIFQLSWHLEHKWTHKKTQSGKTQLFWWNISKTQKAQHLAFQSCTDGFK